MAQEIERKYLFNHNSPEAPSVRAQKGVFIAQGYLLDTPDGVLRVRIAGDEGYLTYKSRNVGATRTEYEYTIPLEDAQRMLATCPQIVRKNRVRMLLTDGHVAEIDTFLDIDLVIVEIELESENEAINLPSFCGLEVTNDAAYYNNAIARRIYETQV